MFLGIVWAAAAAVAGFALGRASMYEWGKGDEAAEPEGAVRKEPANRETDKGRAGRRGREKKGAGTGLKFWAVGSPVAGEVTAHTPGLRPAVVIRPDGDRLYAPAGGKVTRLFPMGNAFLFRTEFGAELYIQAGEAEDDLLGRYYRPRVVQNEIVGKGKLLLEFDRRGLEKEGACAEVRVSVENWFYGGRAQMTGEGEMVRAGEEILWAAEGGAI